MIEVVVEVGSEIRRNSRPLRIGDFAGDGLKESSKVSAHLQRITVWGFYSLSKKVKPLGDDFVGGTEFSAGHLFCDQAFEFRAELYVHGYTFLYFTREMGYSSGSVLG